MPDETPEGYMKDRRGALVPIDAVRPADKLEDEIVRGLFETAKDINRRLTELRRDALEQAGAFRELVLADYGVKKGGAKGNMKLSSFDGAMVIEVSVAEFIAFGTELTAAKALIDGCVERWSEGSGSELKALIEHAFQINKGRIDTARVLGLRRLEIHDDDWKRAMNAIADAVRVTGTKTYLRFAEVTPEGARRPLVLDLANA